MELPKSVSDIHKEYKELLQKMAVVSKQYEESMSLLEEKQKAWAIMEDKMEKNAATVKNKIRLEVGGKVFTTTKSVLLRLENTYFHAMLSSGKWKPDEDGVYFIDRSPKHFDRILEYLRTGEFSIAGLDAAAIEKLQNDLDYYQLASPNELQLQSIPNKGSLCWNPSLCGRCIALVNNNKIAVSIFEGYGDTDICVSSPSLCDRYTVLYTSHSSDGRLRVGFATWVPHHTDYYFYTVNDILTDRQELSTSGSRIECIYDRQQHTISFAINGHHCEVTYTDVHGDLYPAATLFTVGTALELL
jgi:hypothetical protein